MHGNLALTYVLRAAFLRGKTMKGKQSFPKEGRGKMMKQMAGRMIALSANHSLRGACLVRGGC